MFMCVSAEKDGNSRLKHLARSSSPIEGLRPASVRDNFEVSRRIHRTKTYFKGMVLTRAVRSQYWFCLGVEAGASLSENAQRSALKICFIQDSATGLLYEWFNAPYNFICCKFFKTWCEIYIYIYTYIPLESNSKL